jgi:uncharacterized protein YhaN
MRIDHIHIDGFGVWRDAGWGPLSPGLNIFHGPNETGKSTLMAFIRSMLFGFDRRGSTRRYEPVCGGVHGGRLDLTVMGRPVRLERKPSRHVRGAVSLYDGDLTGEDEMLDRLLGGTTRTLYHNVFAFGLEELEHFHTLQENEVATHISGAGLGIGAARWTGVQRDLEERQAALFLPRGQNSVINVAFKELETVRDDLDRTENQPQEYWTAHETRVRLAAEMASLEQTMSELIQKVQYYEKRLTSRPLVERRNKILSRLRELPHVESFPEGGLERWSMLSKQLRNLEDERRRKQADADERRLRRIELRSLADSEELIRKTHALDALRMLMPRMDAVRRVYLASTERRKATEQERNTIESALEAVRPPSAGAFTAFMILIWIGALGALWHGYPYMTAAAAALSLAPLFWYRQRRIRQKSLDEQLQRCAGRLESCLAELDATETEARHLEAEVWRLTGKDEIAPEDIDAQAAEVEKLAGFTDEIRRLDENLADAELEMHRLVQQLQDVQRHLHALLAEAAAATESEFTEHADIFKQRQHLIHELEKLPAEACEPGMLFDMRAEEDAAYEAAVGELSEVEERLARARHDMGRVEERIVLMEKSEERARALSKQETILARLDVASEKWAVLTLCRALLDETRKIYETERQPEVLRQASAFFCIMSEGRYSRVISPLDGGEIQVERADGLRLSPHLLSRGTAEQLYLAMRLALVREYANHVEPLPVVFDDIFVNFDPQRTATSLKAIRDLCGSHQVLIFTCHPHLLSCAQEIVPSAKVFPLQ